ncbi:MAG TPA: tripartite tricarboxylate transporter substrate binding protein [Burkholderiales bacterium]|nr:tripartite tricarboxylate transporter substrate binding protein [Burkholderiales bacterium]
MSQARSRSFARILAACAALAAGAPLGAQEYPVKPVRIIIGFPPGGATDLVSRLMAPKFAGLLKQQFIVDNRAGANGVIGSDLAAKAAPDGYTIHLATVGSLVLSPATGKVPYDPIKDFAPISQAVALQNIFIVHPTLPVRSMKELIALAKAKPGALNFASSGAASPGHLAGELFKNMARVDLVHVPYKGGGPAMIDLIAGHIEIFVAVISTATPQVKAGKARALAVTGPKRAASLPDVPTVAEAALKGYEATNWYGYVVPSATPRAIVERLHQATVTVLGMPDVRKALLDQGIEAAPSSPERFAAYIKSETAKWTKVIKAAGIRVN